MNYHGSYGNKWNDNYLNLNHSINNSNFIPFNNSNLSGNFGIKNNLQCNSANGNGFYAQDLYGPYYNYNNSQFNLGNGCYLYQIQQFIKQLLKQFNYLLYSISSLNPYTNYVPYIC